MKICIGQAGKTKKKVRHSQRLSSEEKEFQDHCSFKPVLSGSELKVEEEKAALAEFEVERREYFRRKCFEDAVNDLGDDALGNLLIKRTQNFNRSASPEDMAKKQKICPIFRCFNEKTAWVKRRRTAWGPQRK